MAAMSAAPGATTFAHSSTSRGNHAGWKSHPSSEHHADEYTHDKSHEDQDSAYGSLTRDPLSVQDINAQRDPFAKRDPNEPFPATKEAFAKRDANEPFPVTKEPITASPPNGGRVSRPETKRTHTDGQTTPMSDEDKWIHRDKLAKIESEELQAAGIILPKPRSQSRPRRDRSTDKANGSRRATDASDDKPTTRSRKNSTLASGSAEKASDVDQGAGWDFRLPDEIAEDPDEYWITSESLGPKGSRIPIAKVSPAPIPIDYLERDAPVPRKMSGTLAIPDDDFSLTNLKPRSRSNSIQALEEATRLHAAQQRSGSENSPPKKGASSGIRKPSTRSTSTNGRGGAAASRPKTRSGSGRETGPNTRPTTRSGDLSPVMKSPEGEPPWMVSAYKPDPRLPPEEQLLPTVARRLQQEKWEKEGKFGNTYDKEFRPLNEQEHLRPPELQRPQPEPDTEERTDEWPLRPEARPEPKSPTPSRPGTSSYSTMPKLQTTPSNSQLAGPRSPGAPPNQMTRKSTQPEQPPMEEKAKEKRGGCGCCVIM